MHDNRVGIETATSVVYAPDDGVARVAIRPGVRHTVPEVRAARAVLARVADGARYGLVLDNSAGGRLEADALRAYLDADAAGNPPVALAIVGVAEPVRRLGNLVLRLPPAALPVRLCGSEVEALEWLRIAPGSRVEGREVLADLLAGVSGPDADLLRSLVEPAPPAVQALVCDLAAAEGTQSKILETMPDAVVVITPGGLVHTVNDAACRLLGEPADRLTGRPFSPAHCPRFGHDDLQLLREGVPVRELPTTLRDSTGGETQVVVNGSVLCDGRGRPELIVLVARDVGEGIRRETELQRAHQKLQEATARLVQAEKLAAVGRLAAGVAHELNQPLNALKLATQAILRHGPTYAPAELEDELRGGLKVIASMQQIVEHMLTYARKPSRRTQDAIDVNALLRRVVGLGLSEMSAHAVVLVTNLVEGLPPVTGDPVELEQVFLNLLTNAMDAVEASPRPAKRIEVRAYRSASLETERVSFWSYDEAPCGERDVVVIEVEDNGGGIGPGIRERIFEPFFTTKEPGKGTGLGLSVANEIVERHLGLLQVDAHPGGGAIFRVVLPVRDERADSSPPRSHRYPGPRPGERP